MAARKFDWTYETLGDAVGCIRETVETLNDVLRKSDAFTSTDGRAAAIGAEVQQHIEQLQKLREELTKTRASFYREFRPGATTGLAENAVAPFRNTTTATQ